MSRKVLVRGSNDIGSAVAHRLIRAGYAVVIHDIPAPTTTRRKMAFTDAIFDGRAALEGLTAVRWSNLEELPGEFSFSAMIPVVVQDFDLLRKTMRPEILVDARMRKHQQPESQLDLAPLTIGLGPNFIAGETTLLVVETSWGKDLGSVIEKGSSQPLEGEPREIGGHARDRYVYAPVAGVFTTDHQIGDPVDQGQVIARIDTTELCAPITGLLRGLTHTGVPVATRTKVIEVDPRCDSPQLDGIAERPARVAEGVLLAVQTWERSQAA